MDQGSFQNRPKEWFIFPAKMPRWKVLWLVAHGEAMAYIGCAVLDALAKRDMLGKLGEAWEPTVLVLAGAVGAAIVLAGLIDCIRSGGYEAWPQGNPQHRAAFHGLLIFECFCLLIWRVWTSLLLLDPFEATVYSWRPLELLLPLNLIILFL